MQDNYQGTTKTQQAVWYYNRNGEEKGPVSASSLIQLNEVGIIKSNTLVWTQGFSEWKPFSDIGKSSNVSVGTGHSRIQKGTNKVLKEAILIIILAVVLVAGGIFSYFRFFATSPLDGGWQYKNILGTTNEVLLFDGGKCWIDDTGSEPFVVSYSAVEDGNNSYQVTFTKDNGSTILFAISFKDNNTINVAQQGSTDIYTMTRIDKAMAKNMIGIS